MHQNYFPALADVLFGNAEALARRYHELTHTAAVDSDPDHQRSRCADAINAIGKAIDPERFEAACAALDAARTREPVAPVCNRCGSHNVFRDASAEWDTETQQWVIAGLYDSTTCQACEAESDTLCDWCPVTPEAQSPTLADMSASKEQTEGTRHA